jgi:hypothetical protein
MRSLSLGKALLFAVAVDAALFAAAGLVGNNQPGWRGPLGDVLWIAALLGAAAVLLLLLLVATGIVRRRVTT